MYWQIGYGFIPVVLLLLVASSLRILREYQRGVVFQLGRFWKVKGPGLVILIPGIQQMVRVDLRTIVMDSVIVNSLSISGPRVTRFTEGIQTAAIIVTLLPIMLVFPFLQKYFLKGIMIGAIKA